MGFETTPVHAADHNILDNSLGVGNDSDDCGCAYTNPVSEALGKRSIAWSNLHTTPENKAFLRALAPKIRMNMSNLRVVLVHGSPRKINEYLFENRPNASLERLMDSSGADVLVCGHTHIPYHRILPSGRQAGTQDRCSFEVSLFEAEAAPPHRTHRRTLSLWMVVGPGDQGEPVITIGFPENF